jgi:hypothetical protein
LTLPPDPVSSSLEGYVTPNSTTRRNGADRGTETDIKKFWHVMRS